MKLSLQITLLFLYVFLVIKRSDASPRLADSLSVEIVKEHVTILGSDSMAGRAPGTDGIERAATYIGNMLETYRILPAGVATTYRQPIPMHGSQPMESSELRLLGPDTERLLKFGDDYLLYRSGPQTFIPNPVPLVFVGFGIIAPEYDYNDYQQIDVSGKIVVFLEGEPESQDPDYFDGPENTIYAYPESKQRIAISRGAIGSILITAPGTVQVPAWKRLKQEFYFEDVTLGYRVTGHLSIILKEELNPFLFNHSSYACDDIAGLIRQNKLHPFNLNLRLSFRGEFRERDFISSNIIGMIPGNDVELKKTYLLLTAHYDHLGTGRPVGSDSIYNGVMDNAIGVAGLLELARMFTRPGNETKRSLIFLFLTGEEKGLLGSQYYVDHPLFPLYRTVANINIDGLGFVDTFTDIIPVGAELSDLGGLISEYAAEMGIEVSGLPAGFSVEESFGRSDQITFARAGIPSVLLADGYRYEHITRNEGIGRLRRWFDHVYHTPFDDMDQPVNFKATERHLEIIYEISRRLANHEGEIHWKSGAPYMNVRLRSIAEKR